jgi:general secretion pathway protein D
MRARTLFLSAGVAVLVTASGLVPAQSPASTARTYLLKFQNVDIPMLAESVASATGKTMIIHPQVRGVVTLVSDQALSSAQMFDAFAQVLVEKGYTVEVTRDVVKIYPGRPGD